MPSKNLEALVLVAELTEIVTFELSVKRIEVLKTEPSNPSEQVPVRPNYNLTTATLPHDSGFLIRLAVTIDLPIGQISCDVGATYKLKSELDFALDALILIEYSNEVAVMTLLPFVRQYMADLSQRSWGFPLLMPVMPRGALQFISNP